MLITTIQTIAYIYHNAANKTGQQVYMAEAQTWQDPNKHVITLRTNHPSKHVHIHHQTCTQCVFM